MHKPMPSSVSAPLPGTGAPVVAEEQETIAPAQIRQWKVMGVVACALLMVVAYLYHAKIAMPLEQMEPVQEAEVVTMPAAPDVVVSLPDEVSPSTLSAPSGQQDVQ